MKFFKTGSTPVYARGLQEIFVNLSTRGLNSNLLNHTLMQYSIIIMNIQFNTDSEISWETSSLKPTAIKYPIKVLVKPWEIHCVAFSRLVTFLLQHYMVFSFTIKATVHSSLCFKITMYTRSCGISGTL